MFCQTAGAFPATETYNEEAFPSGQRGQTVNLLHLCFGGPNPPASTSKKVLHTFCVCEAFLLLWKRGESGDAAGCGEHLTQSAARKPRVSVVAIQTASTTAVAV